MQRSKPSRSKKSPKKRNPQTQPKKEAKETKVVAKPSLRRPRRSKTVKPTQKSYERALSRGVRSGAITARAANPSLRMKSFERISSRNVLDIASSLALPQAKMSVRLPTSLNRIATAIATVFDKDSVSTSGDDSTSPTGPIGAEDTFFVLTRHPACALIMSHWIQDAVQYTAFFPTVVSNTYTSPVVNSLSIPVTNAVKTYFPICYLVATTGDGFESPHGDILYVGLHASKPDARWIWLDAGFTVGWEMGDGGSTGAPTVISGLDFCHPGEQIAETVFKSATMGAPVSFTITQPGYYAPWAIYFDPTYGTHSTIQMSVTNCQFSADTANFMCAHRAVPHFAPNAVAISQMRINGSSMLINNTSNVTVKSGLVAAAQSFSTYSWYDYISGGIGEIENINGAEAISFENGAYTFLKPGSTTDLEFGRTHMVDNDTLMEGTFPIDDQKTNACILYFTAAQTNFKANYQWFLSMEYTSSDPWRDTRVPRLNVDDLNAALKEIGQLPDIYENPVHFANIWNTLKKWGGAALRAVIKYGPTAVEAASALAAL